MYGRKVKLRFFFVFLILTILSLSIFLILKSLEENVVYFKSPSEIKILSEIDKNKIRIGGMVKKNSILIEEKKLKFIVTDFKNEIKKTKEMNKILNKFEANNSLIILDKNSKDKVFKSLRNLPNVKTTDINHFSAFDIIKFKKVIFTETSVKELEKRYE